MKLPPAELEKILAHMQQPTPVSQQRVSIGLKNNEDAAIVRLPQDFETVANHQLPCFNTGLSLVQTVDFLAPVVNNPYEFGRIAAANALSDIYAMGGIPWCAMNIACFPTQKLPADVFVQILKGSSDALASANVALAGGHTVEDQELKFGLSVTGIINPQSVISNAGLQAGDALLLTKPIGTGILALALKADWEQADEIEKTLIYWATKLNAAPANTLRKFQLKAATDITGFGLAGHLLEMAQASRVCIQISMQAIPLMDKAYELASLGLAPSACFHAKHFYKNKITYLHETDPVLQDFLFDPQTSGGIVMAVPQDKLAAVKNHLTLSQTPFWQIGCVLPVTEHNSGKLHISE